MWCRKRRRGECTGGGGMSTEGRGGGGVGLLY